MLELLLLKLTIPLVLYLLAGIRKFNDFAGGVSNGLVISWLNSKDHDGSECVAGKSKASRQPVQSI